MLGHKLVYKGVAGPDTSSAPTIVPVLNSAKIPMMAVAGESSYDRNTDKYFLRLFPPDSANGTAMTLWAQKKGYTRIAAVFGTDSGSQGTCRGSSRASRHCISSSWPTLA